MKFFSAEQILNQVIEEDGSLRVSRSSAQALNLVFDPTQKALRVRAIGGGSEGGGERGMSAYEIALQHGFVGSEEEWLLSLKAQSDGIPVGGIILSGNRAPSDLFKECDGRMLSKSEYPALFEAIGDSFTPPPQKEWINGQPWNQQYTFNEFPAASDLVWEEVGDLGESVVVAEVVQAGGRVWILGGYQRSKILSAPIDGNGVIGPFASAGNLPASLGYSQVVMMDDKVYLLGGYTFAAVSSIYRATVGTNGALGAWTSVGSLPLAHSHHRAVVTKNLLYALGTYQSASISRAPIGTDGTPGAWTSAGSTPENLFCPFLCVTKNRVYLIGGRKNGATSASSKIFSASISADGTLGTWEAEGILPFGLSEGACVVTQKSVYLIGGYITSSTYSDKVLVAPIGGDGRLGAFIELASRLPRGLVGHCATLTSGGIYVFGGTGNTKIYRATFGGGENDYRTQTYRTLENEGFSLPNYSSEIPAKYHYIRVR